MFSQLSETSFSITTILLVLLPIISLGWLYLKHVRNTCRNCDKYFEKASELKNHISSAHQTKKGRQRCSICGKEFENSTALLFHYKTRHKELLDHMLSSHITIDYKKIGYHKDEAQETSKKVA